MANPTDATDYPVFAATVGKQDILRALLAYAHESTGLMGVILRINRTNLAGLTDGATVYSTTDSFNAAE